MIVQEQTAAAIALFERVFPDSPGAWLRVSPDVREHYLEMAKTALEAAEQVRRKH